MRLTRRSLMQLGALRVAGFAPVVSAGNALAQGRVSPRGSADAVIFLNLLGGPSQMDTFDVKEGKWAPENRDVRSTPQGLKWPFGLLPGLAGHLDKLLLMRGMEAWDTVHSRGQYYLQVGHAVSPARATEMPSVGAVVAHEMSSRRKPGDFLPPFVAMNYDASTMYGPLQQEGCLASGAAPLVLDAKGGKYPFVLADEDRERFHRRWNLLQEMDGSRRDLRAKPLAEFDEFARASQRMMEQPRIREIFALTAEEKKRYGGTPIGDACLLARNMVAAQAGARYLFLTHGDWDSHGDIYRPSGFRSIYTLCRELDQALSALLTDLAARGLLERTLVVTMGEFGRTPGDLNYTRGRDHWDKAMVAAVAGGGVVGGRALGATDDEGGRVKNPGWRKKRPMYMEDVFTTIYSALGIDWTKRLTKTPSGRDFVYIDPAAGSGVVDFGEIGEWYA